VVILLRLLWCLTRRTVDSLSKARRADAKSFARGRGRSTFATVALSPEAERIDKWLWAVRIFRTRSLATDACRAGSVTINGQPVKPSREVRGGVIVVARQGLIRRTLKVLGVPASRVGAKGVAAYCEDQTPAEEFAQARRQRVQQLLARAKGSGRPTKRDRRRLDRLFS
jgi:ribosome-associated heat shock protein Hsp15